MVILYLAPRANFPVRGGRAFCDQALLGVQRPGPWALGVGRERLSSVGVWVGR